MNQPLNLKRPKGLDKYLITTAAKTQYLIFDIKADTGYITKLDKKVKLSDYFNPKGLVHNGRILCIELNTEITLKEKKYGRKNITEYGRVLWFQKRGRTTYAQLDEYTIDYTGDEATVSYWASAQYKLNKDEQTGYKNHPYDGWKKMKEAKTPSPNIGIAYYWMEPRFAKTIIYEESIQNIGTDLKYADRDIRDAYEAVSYFVNFLKYQSIEILDKAGFKEVVDYKIKGGGSKSINWRAKELRKILKLNTKEIREFRETDMTISCLEKYHTCRKSIPGISFEETKLLTQRFELLKSEISGLSSYLASPEELLRAIKYLQKQNEKYSKDSTAGDYLDYLADCRKLQLNMMDKKVLRPKNFQAEHARISKIVAEKQEKINERAFAEKQKEITDMTEPYISRALIIRPAESAAELTVESEFLHHCVRTYKEKVIKGNCAILFIRKLKEPDVPFYTLEIDNSGKLVQCRGKYNCSMTEEVKKFVEEWLHSRRKRKRVA